MKPIDRRHVLRLAAAGAALHGLGIVQTAAAAAAQAAAQGAARPAPLAGALDDPANLHRVYRRIRFAADDRVVFWWLKGRRYGYVDNLMVPYFDMHVGSWHRCRELDDGRYEVATASAMYFTDLASGELVEDWPNPITGKRVLLRYPAPTRAVTVYAYSGAEQAAAPTPGMRMERHHVVAPLELVGDEAWLREETWIKAIRETAGTTRTQKVHDMYTYSSPVAALRDPKARFAPAVAHFNDYNDWSPRFEMGDQPGGAVARCSGRKVASIEAMPTAILRIGRRLHAEAFRDPARTLG